MKTIIITEKKFYKESFIYPPKEDCKLIIKYDNKTLGEGIFYFINRTEVTKETYIKHLRIKSIKQILK